MHMAGDCRKLSKPIISFLGLCLSAISGCMHQPPFSLSGKTNVKISFLGNPVGHHCQPSLLHAIHIYTLWMSCSVSRVKLAVLQWPACCKDSHTDSGDA